MKHGSLFSGIGGFDLAAEWMGWENVFHCEWNPFGQKVLKHYWPNAISYTDITKTDFSIHRGEIDILTGGFPCQPFSGAGERKGTEDNRYLWPEMLRAIGEIHPRFIVGENVSGLVNWSGGLVFEQVQADLETQGYESAAFILPACSKNAPHRRDRVWFIANSKGNGGKKKTDQWEKFEPDNRTAIRDRVTANGESRNVADTQIKGLEREEQRNSKGTGERYRARNLRGNWNQWPTQSPICGGNDGVSYRVDRLKSLGNAIVPQVAYEIFKAIEKLNQSPMVK